MKYKIAWSTPRNYKFIKWLFDCGDYKCMKFIRLFGILILWYSEKEKTITHPITGSVWTK
jgi:hypothetical protein